MNSLIKFSILFSIFCAIAVECQKPGSCPPAPAFGICLQQCSHDFNCSGELKCCSNGCGHVCMKPAQEKVEKKCPPHDGMIGICVINANSCWSDSMCKPDQKCCPKGCGSECMYV